MDKAPTIMISVSLTLNVVFVAVICLLATNIVAYNQPQRQEAKLEVKPEQEKTADNGQYINENEVSIAESPLPKSMTQTN